MLRLCLLLFQICGFYPVKIEKLQAYFHYTTTKSFRQNFVFWLWSVLHCFVIACFMIYVIVFSDKMLYSETPIGKINDILVYFSLLSAHFATVVESFVKRKYFLKYFYHFSKSQKFSKPQMSVKWKKLILAKVFLLVVLTIANESLIITGVKSVDQQWANFWLASVFSLCLTRLRHLQHIFFIDIIFFSLQDMNRHLRNSIAWTRAVGEEKSFSRIFIYKNVKNVKEQFKNLMEMLICVNKIFCWSQVFNMGQNFIEITSDLYWVYAFATGPKFLWGKSWLFIKSFFKLFLFKTQTLLIFTINYFFLETLIAFLPTAVIIVLLLNSATRCIKEVITIDCLIIGYSH